MTASFNDLAGDTRQPSSPTIGNLMGAIKCDYDRQGKRHLGNYKKRFWVVNQKACRLEVYKNDQAHVPMEVIRAEDIRSVIYAADKQNRFYVMQLRPRLRPTICFRLNSLDEREMWSDAINALIAKYSTGNRRRNMLQQVLRRCRHTAQNLKVSIIIDAARLLTDIPDDLLQYVLEAMDVALSNIAVIVRNCATGAAPRIFKLSIETNDDKEWTFPQYDPTTKTAIFTVLISRDNLNHVTFKVTEPEDVISIMQSNVFRNPLIEGWLDAAPGCAEVYTRILETLRLSKKQCPITFQWGKYLSDGDDRVEVYLQKHVHEAFFKDILLAIHNTIVEIEHIIDDSCDVRLSPEMTPHRQGASNNEQSLHRRLNSEFLGFHSQSYNSTMPLYTAPFGATCNAAGVDSHTIAVQLLTENLTGFAICLSKKLVEECKVPPEVLVSHSVDYDLRCRPAFLLMDKYRQVLGKSKNSDSRGKTMEPLREQLFDLAFHNMLTLEMSAIRTALNTAVGKSVRVTIQWDEALKTLMKIGCSVTSLELPRLVRVVGELCVPRVQLMMQLLNRKDDHLEDTEANVLTIFSRCVSCVVISFVPFLQHTVNPSVIPDPSVNDGVLTDTLLCTDEARAAKLVDSVNQHSGTGASHRKPPSLLRNIYAYPARPRLGSWCEAYFSVPEHIIPAHQHSTVLEDEFGSDSDAGTADQGMDYGEAVAHERSAEIQVLNMQRVVNTIYDSQGNLVDLKISAKDILHAIRSLSSAFDGRPINKHDLIRILTFNLHRLRLLYSRVADGVAASVLTEKEATALLQRFCEYSSSETLIPSTLLARSVIQRSSHAIGWPYTSQLSRTHLSSDAKANQGSVPRFYNFQDITAVALNSLLPAEAHVARRAWRTGFVFGLQNTGKSLVINCIRGVVRPTVASVGLFRQVVAFGEWVWSLNELGGRESFRKNWIHYARRIAEVNFLCCVVDSQLRRSYNEAHSYLREVATYFSSVPLLVIFNNYRDLPRPICVEDLEQIIRLQDIRSINDKRPVVVCTCDITVVHSANRIIPDDLLRALQKISTVLCEQTPADQKPQPPKASGGADDRSTTIPSHEFGGAESYAVRR